MDAVDSHLSIKYEGEAWGGSHTSALGYMNEELWREEMRENYRRIVTVKLRRCELVNDRY